MEVALLLGLIILNGVFAMSEIALVTARRGRLQALEHQGDLGAAAAIRLNADPTRFLSTIQIGITSIGILNGIVGEAIFARPFAEWLAELGLDATAASYAATGLVVIVVTYLSIVLGELVLAVVPTLGGHGLANKALRSLPAPTVGLFLLGEPVIASLLALAVFGEVPGVWTLAGGAVVLAALGLVLTQSTR